MACQQDAPSSAQGAWPRRPLFERCASAMGASGPYDGCRDVQPVSGHQTERLKCVGGPAARLVEPMYALHPPEELAPRARPWPHHQCSPPLRGGRADLHEVGGEGGAVVQLHPVVEARRAVQANVKHPGAKDPRGLPELRVLRVLEHPNGGVRASRPRDETIQFRFAPGTVMCCIGPGRSPEGHNPSQPAPRLRQAVPPQPVSSSHLGRTARGGSEPPLWSPLADPADDASAPCMQESPDAPLNIAAGRKRGRPATRRQSRSWRTLAAAGPRRLPTTTTVATATQSAAPSLLAAATSRSQGKLFSSLPAASAVSDAGRETCIRNTQQP